MDLILLSMFVVLFGVLGLLLGTGGAMVALLVPGLRTPVAQYFERASATTLSRPAFTFGDSSDLLLKRRDYDADQGSEVIASGSDQLEVANPDSSIWSFHGTPLSIVDEFYGVAIDQRHLHPGEVLQDHIQEGTLWVGDFWGWINQQAELAAPAYAPVPKDGQPGTLQAVRTLFWGGEEADHPDTVKTFVAKAHEARNDTAVWKQLLVPAAFLVLGFGLLWFAAKFGPSSSGNQPPARDVGAGMLLLALPNVRDRLAGLWGRLTARLGAIRDRDEQREKDGEQRDGDGAAGRRSVLPPPRRVGLVLVGLVGLAIAMVVLYVMLLVFGPIGLFFVLGAFLIGFGIFPFGGPLLNKRLPTPLAERFAGVYLRLGLLPYDNPDLELSSDGQRFVEGDGSGPRYRLAGQHVGFTLASDSIEELFGNRADSASAVRSRANAGDNDIVGIPSGYTETSALTFDRIHGYIPEDPSDTHQYARLDRVMAPFQGANVGSRSKKALENAKEEFGAGWQELNTKQILWASLGAAVFGMAAGYIVFFL